MSTIQNKLDSLGLQLPETPKAVANYVPWVRTGNLIIISGQLPFEDGQLPYKGKVGVDLSLEEGQKAARQCALNILTQAAEACDGNLDAIKRCVRLGGFVNCMPDFTDQPKVINGASDLMVEVFGDKGLHARAAVGVPALPLGVAVEIEATFEV